MKQVAKNLLAASMLAGLVACGGGGGSSGGGTQVNLSGTAGKGLLLGAEVKAYEVINGKLSTTPWGTTTTQSQVAFMAAS